jgi:glycogen debranching enzyme
MDRLKVRNIVRRKKHKLEGNNYNCVICLENREETTFHLFFSCPFNRECWSFNLDFFTMMDVAKQQ